MDVGDCLGSKAIGLHAFDPGDNVFVLDPPYVVGDGSVFAFSVFDLSHQTTMPRSVRRVSLFSVHVGETGTRVVVDRKKPLESLDSRGFPLCAEGDLNPHPLSRTSTSS